MTGKGGNYSFLRSEFSGFWLGLTAKQTKSI